VFDAGGPAEAKQRAALLAAAAELRQRAQDVALEVCRAEQELRGAQAELEQCAGDLASRTTALREGTERLFAVGEVEYREVVLARREEGEARRALLESESAVAKARVALEAPLGGGVHDGGMQVRESVE